jgi:hypothetical protein
MRKFILILTCVIFIFSLLVAGCGKQEQQEPAKTETPSEEMETPPQQETPADTTMQQEGETMEDTAAAMEQEGGGE